MASKGKAQDPKQEIVQQLSSDLREARIKVSKLELELEAARDKKGVADRTRRLEAQIRDLRESLTEARAQRDAGIARAHAERDAAIAEADLLRDGMLRAIGQIEKEIGG